MKFTQHFKSRIKELGDAGKTRFLEIVTRITVDALDANHEKVLTLKQ